MKETTSDKQIERLKDILSEEPEQNWKHQWMYSFLYADVGPQPHNEIYLCGYCKMCNKGLTILMSRSYILGEARLTELDVPKFGCVPPPVG